VNIWEQLNGGRSDGELQFTSSSLASSTSWGDVAAQSRRMVPALRKMGVGPGSRVAVLLSNSLESVAGLGAVWFAGGAVASLPLRSRGMSAEEYEKQLQEIVSTLGAAFLITDEDMRRSLPESTVEALNVRPWLSFEGLVEGAVTPPEADDIAVIQYSSGSTGNPSGCMISSRAIDAQISMLMEMMSAVPGSERAVCWVPLSHDMGLFGVLLTSWIHKFSLHLMSPNQFGLAPASWMKNCASYKATITVGTNTGLALATRSGRRRTLEPERLDDLRIFILGAERNEWETLADAVAVYGPAGLRHEAFQPAYGLAEATLAVTGTPVDQRPRYVDVDPDALAEGEIQPSTGRSSVRLVSAGVACTGTELVGVTEALTHIGVRGPALFDGYYSNPDRTAERLQDGVLRTGDLGFVVDGHLYPVGRQDDMISIGGRNVYTREIELAIDSLDNVRTSCTTLVRSVASGELVLMLEPTKRSVDFDQLTAHVSRIVMAKSGLAVDRCVFLAKGSIPKTPSGKIQRHRCSHLFESERLEILYEHGGVAR